MTPRRIAGGLALATIVVAAAGTLLAPPRRDGGTPAPPLDAAEQAATIAALAPPKRARPLVAVLGASEGTETTDFIVPTGVLRAAGVADVVTVGTHAGTIPLMPALAVEPDATLDTFDAAHPDGADYVVVPALHRSDDPAVLAWVRAQAASGATIVGVCDGALVLAAAGLLDGRRATGHWYSRDTLRGDHPTLRWANDRRYVVDRGVVTTTGVTASMPVSLALVEAIAGRARAAALAAELGVARWDATHDSAAFGLDGAGVRTVVANTVAFWGHETVGVPVGPGVDEIALALVADAWSRTYRSRALTIAPTAAPVRTRHGLTITVDRTDTAGVDRLLPALGTGPPAAVLDGALADIGRAFGAPTAAFVALQLEYPTARR